MFAAQLLQEGGDMNTDTIRDHGCSVGIPQRNVCNAGYSAKKFLNTFPAWLDYKTQLKWMVTETVETYNGFHKDIFRTIVHHNCPACASVAQDACYVGGKRMSKCYYQRVEITAKELTSSI